MKTLLNWIKMLFEAYTTYQEASKYAKITLLHSGRIPSSEYRKVLKDAIEYRQDVTDIYLPDTMMKVYRKSDIVAFLKLDETDQIEYVPEEMDCDDFAVELFYKGFGMMWIEREVKGEVKRHAMNFFEDGMVKWYVEPQTDQISATLNGAHIIFELGR